MSRYFTWLLPVAVIFMVCGVIACARPLPEEPAIQAASIASNVAVHAAADAARLRANPQSTLTAKWQPEVSIALPLRATPQPTLATSQLPETGSPSPLLPDAQSALDGSQQQESSSPAPAPTAPATPNPTATPVPTPFTIVWFPDTQASAYAEPEALTAMGKWVAEHAESDNLVYVLQTGDLVDNGFVEEQWQNFELAYNQFAGKVPYFCIAGNHDLGVKRQEWDGYLARPYAHTVPPEQEYENGKAAYTLFTAGGVDFVVVGVGHGAEEESVLWVRDVFDRYPDRYGILMMHGYLHGKGTFVEPPAWTMYYRVVSRCKNIYMTLSGHYRGTAYRAFHMDDDYDQQPDRTVHTFLCNYQHYARLGGQLRLLRFDPADGSLTVETFSAFTGHPMRDDTMKQSVFRLEHVLGHEGMGGTESTEGTESTMPPAA